MSCYTIQDIMKGYDLIMKWFNVTLKYSKQQSKLYSGFDACWNANKIDYLTIIIIIITKLYIICNILHLFNFIFFFRSHPGSDFYNYLWCLEIPLG